MPEQLPGIPAAHKSERQLRRIDLFDSVRVGLIKAGISVCPVKIIYTQIILRRFIFYDIVLSEDPADRLFDRNVLLFSPSFLLKYNTVYFQGATLTYITVQPSDGRRSVAAAISTPVRLCEWRELNCY